jgi:putative DNA primase/helicase
MKLKNILIEKMEREAQASPLPPRNDVGASNLGNKNVSNIAEATNFLDSATFYSNHNIKVIPVRRQDKKPLTNHGWKDASTDKVVLQEWNKQFPNCNIGIPTGIINNIFVVDVDGEIGVQSLAALENAYGKLDAPTVNTGKGKHLYFKMPENVDIKCSTSKIAPHIDIRGNGGYVVAPPSIHPNGNKYTWVNFDFSQDFPNAPEWLINLITNPAESNFEDLLEEIATSSEGMRNTTLLGNAIKICNSANKQFLDMENIKNDVIDAGIASGLSRAESERTVNNAMRFSGKCNNNSIADEPDMDVLKVKDLLPAPKLNTRIFKGLEPWIIQTAENTNAPVDYVAFALLAGAAGIVGLSRFVSPWAEWVEPCCLWIGTVGEPSSGKTPATTPIRRILNQIEEDRKEPYFAKLAEWKRDKEVSKQKKKAWEDKVKENPDFAPHFPSSAIMPEKPQTYRFVYGDTTQEAITKDMERNIKGAILFRDELSAWICGMNRYNGGSSERGFWLEAFNGHKFVCDRVKYDDDRLEIKNLLVSVFGTIQPQRLIDTLFDDRGDGFLARFLWVYPAPIPPAIPQNTALPDTALKALQKLDTLLNPYADFAEEQKKCLSLSVEAKDVFNTWYIRHLTKTQKEESNIKYFLGKGQGYVLRLALLLELLWWSSSESAEPTEVTAEAIQTAISLYDSYLLPMCERVYNMYYSPEENIEARALARWIIENKPEKFILRDVYNNGNVKYLRIRKTAEKGAKRLMELNWLQSETSRNSNTKGKRRTTYYVNPEVYTFAENY